jgi:hypothetical protein
MAHVVGEKNLAGSVKIELVDAFMDSIPGSFKKKHALTAAVKIWLSIPSEERNILLAAENEGMSLEDVIANIVSRVIAQTHHKSGQQAGEVQKRKHVEHPSKSAKSAG